jgi:hypothetical protein
MHITSYSLWMVGDTQRLTPLSFFPDIIDASCRVELVDDGHTNSKTAHRHGTRYFIAVQ